MTEEEALPDIGEVVEGSRCTTVSESFTGAAFRAEGSMIT